MFITIVVAGCVLPLLISIVLLAYFCARWVAHGRRKRQILVDHAQDFRGPIAFLVSTLLREEERRIARGIVLSILLLVLWSNLLIVGAGELS